MPPFTHAIMSYDRYNVLIDVIDSLLKFTDRTSIVVYDSGLRTEVFNLCEKRKIRYVPSNVRNSRENFENILKNEKQRLFVHHDDDIVNRYIIDVKKTIIKEKLSFATSLKRADHNFKLSTGEQQKVIENIMALYFLDPNGNCPLISGLYCDNRKEWTIRPKFQFNGKHVDVGYILDLFSRPNTKIFNVPYINYNEDVFGDNDVKVLEDRLALAQFIQSLPIPSARLYSLLATIRGPREKLHFFNLFIEFSKHPKLFFMFIKKCVHRW